MAIEEDIAYSKELPEGELEKSGTTRAEAQSEKGAAHKIGEHVRMMIAETTLNGPRRKFENFEIANSRLASNRTSREYQLKLLTGTRALYEPNGVSWFPQTDLKDPA